MKFDSFEAFLYMDGHGLFIWAAYGITFIVLLINLWWPRRVRVQIIRTTRAEQRRQEGEKSP